MAKFLAVSGSIRQGSYNVELAHYMVRRAQEKGWDAEYIDLHDYPMPLFNEDLEQGEKPECALDLAKRFAEADAVFLATPEYNGSVTPILKNTIDWLTRQGQGAFSHAIFGIGSVSSGALAGVMALSHMRDILSKLSALMAPTPLGIGMGATAFNEEGEIADPRIKARADKLVDELTSIKRG